MLHNICQWQTFDLDHALCEGDCNYKQLNTLNLLAADELPNVVQTADGCMFSVDYLSIENGEVSAHAEEFAFLRGIHNGCVDEGVRCLVFISGFTIAVIPYLDSYYLFDSHSRNGQGSMILQGKSVLLKFAGLQVVYLQERNQNHANFQIQYVHVNISDENISHVLNTFQRSRGATRQQRHRVKISKSQEFKDSVLHDVGKIIQGSCYQGTSKHKSTLSSKNLITTVISLCWSVLRKMSLWYSNDLDHIISMGEIILKSHNIGTFQSLDSYVLNLCNKKFELHIVRKESVTISDLKSVSVITEICRSVDSTGLIVSIRNYYLP